MKKGLSLPHITRISKLKMYAIPPVMIFSVCFFSACSVFPVEEAMVQPPIKEPPKITYTVHEAKRGTIEKRIDCKGSFIPVNQFNMSFKHGGQRLLNLNVKLGDSIKKGDIVAELDTDNLNNQIKQQQIKLKRVQLEYELIKSDGLQQIELSRHKLDDLKNKLERITLAGIETEPDGLSYDIFSKEDIETLKMKIAEQEMDLNSVEVSYRANIQKAELDIELAELQLSDMEEQMDKARLISPADGVVTYTHPVKAGEFVDAYQTIVRIADPSFLLLEHSEEKVSSFNLGARVMITYNELTLDGEVVMNPYNMPPDADNNFRRSVRIKVEDLPKDARIGDTAHITLLLDKKDNVIVLPKNLVHFKVNRKFVQVLENGVKKERDVEIGIQTEAEIEIVKGLEGGESVIER